MLRSSEILLTQAFQGNDEEGSDAESGPTTAIDKPVNRTSKRNGPEAVPERTAGGDRGGRGGARRGGFSGSEDGGYSCNDEYQGQFSVREMRSDLP